MLFSKAQVLHVCVQKVLLADPCEVCRFEVACMFSPSGHGSSDLVV